MFVEIGKSIQIKLLKDAISKAGSERKMEKATKIPHASIGLYAHGTHKLTAERFKKILNFLELNENDFSFKLIDPKIYRIKGGKAVFQKYLKENRFTEIHQKMRKASSAKMKEWHKKMKNEEPEKYYNTQYERFKKVGGYACKSKRGEIVRNKLEQEVADLLFGLNQNYSYEPLIKAEKHYFPDFKIGNLIIECTMWKGIEKAYLLAKKIADLENAGFTVKVVIPDNLREFYKPIERNIVNISQLKAFLPE